MGLIVPKRLLQTTWRRVITQKMEKFSSTAAEAYDLFVCLFLCLFVCSFFHAFVLSFIRSPNHRVLDGCKTRLSIPLLFFDPWLKTGLQRRVGQRRKRGWRRYWLDWWCKSCAFLVGVDSEKAKWQDAVTLSKGWKKVLKIVYVSYKVIFWDYVVSVVGEWVWSIAVIVHTIKPYRESRGMAPLILHIGTTWWWVVNFMSRSLLPPEKSPCAHWIGGWVGRWAGLDALEKTKTSWLLQYSNPGLPSP